ncbi:hypothetical protein BGZ60DRAFT_561205 [Tricladium varicosporioides]|nr:hypothetical protein BGZ60DRAFT_561205 [Hymenoscyphus varicosporioides]
MASARLPPLAKLPLSARAQVRDKYEAKKADWEKELSNLLGVEWKFEIDTAALWPYLKEENNKNSFGIMLANYVDGFVENLRVYWLPANGEDGKEELNSCAYAHIVTLDVDEGNKHNTHRPPYNSSEIRDGKVVMLFHADWFGSNPFDVVNSLVKALEEAPAPPS